MHPLLAVVLLCTTPAPDDPMDFLRAAIRVQTPEGQAPEIVDFQADLVVSLFDPEKGGTPQSARVTEFYRRKGRFHQYHRILTLLPENRTTHLMTDGTVFALWEDGTKLVHDLLASPELKDDLEQLRTERARTQELIEIFFLANLDGTDVKWTFGVERPPLKLDSGPTVPVRDLMRYKESDPRQMMITIGREDHRVYEIRLMTKERDELFRFDYHEEIVRVAEDGSSQRLLMPKRVEYLENGKRVMTAATENASHIKFNVGLSDRVFAPPAF